MQGKHRRNSNVILILFFIFILFNNKILQAQEYYSSVNVKSTITASADNYFPKLNEQVKIKLKIRAPFDLLYDENLVGFIFNAEDSIEIVKGTQWEKKIFHKGEIFEKEIVVQFTKKTVCNVKAYFTKNTTVLLSFYVDNVFRKSDEVQNIQKNIELLKEYIANSNKELEMPLLGIVGKHPSKVKKQSVQLLNEYDKSSIEESKKWNAYLFKKLKMEYDSLYNIYNMKRFKNY